MSSHAPTPEVVVERPADPSVTPPVAPPAIRAASSLRPRADDIQTAAINPADVVGARRLELRRTLSNLVSQIACHMADASTTNAARARCAQAIEVNVSLLGEL